MKIKYVLWAALFLVAVGVVAAQQPTMLSLQGRVLDSSGALVNNGNLRVTVSTSDSCEQNIIYDYTYNNLIQNGIFSTLLGNDTFLNLTYNQDYYVCTYVNGEIQKNAANVNRTKFRGGQGQIQPSNITNGTFANGNYTFMDNLTFGAGWFIKNDDSFLYRVTRAAIQFKNLLDRTANENVTGNWTFSGNVTIEGNVSATNFIGDGTGLTGVSSGDSEWEMIIWRNFTSTNTSVGNTFLIGNISPSNQYKVDFALFHERRRCDNEQSEADADSTPHIALRLNNHTGMNYYNFGYGGFGAGGMSDMAERNGFNITSWNGYGAFAYTAGELIIYQINRTGKLQTFVDARILSPVGNTTFNLWKGNINEIGKLSELRFVASAPTTGAESCTAGFLNGTVIIYVNNKFNSY